MRNLNNLPILKGKICILILNPLAVDLHRSLFNHTLGFTRRRAQTGFNQELAYPDGICADSKLFNIIGYFSLLKNQLKPFLCSVGLFLTVVHPHDFPSQPHLSIPRVYTP